MKVPMYKIGFEDLFEYEGQIYRKSAFKDGGTIEVGYLINKNGEADPEQRLELPRATEVNTVEEPTVEVLPKPKPRKK